ncbi:MAG: hypothetical protein PHC80_00310 [Eubacteriales bacterium]|nr:hypothetical protein [Eubacteriales bacterium]
MKKFFTAILALTLLLALSVTTLAASQTFIGVSGVVTGTGTNGLDTYIEVKKSDGEIMQLIVDANTRFINCTGGVPMALSSVPVGASFYAWTRMPATKSVPAQSYLHTMIVTVDKSTANGFFFEVGSVSTDANGTHLTNAKGDLIATIPQGLTVEAFAETGMQSVAATSIGKGAQLMVWYDIATASLPAQATLTKVLVFTSGTPVASTPVVNVPSTGSPAPILLALPLAVLLVAAYRLRRA